MRIFTCIELPKEVKHSLLSIYPQLAKLVEGNFIEETNLHITLNFLGEVDNVDKVISACKLIKDSSFDAEITGVGAFPSNKYPKVIWAGISKGCSNLQNIQKNLCEAFHFLDYKEDHNFTPHITLVRVKSVKSKLDRFLLDNSRTLFGKFKVDKFTLMKSVLTPNRPKYSVVEEFKLNGKR